MIFICWYLLGSVCIFHENMICFMICYISEKLRWKEIYHKTENIKGRER